MPAVVIDGLVSEWVGKLAKNGTTPGNNTDPTSTWTNSYGSGNISLVGANFGWTTSSGWAGTGTNADPYRLVLDGTNDYGTFPTGQFNYNPTSIEFWMQRLSTGASNTTYLLYDQDDATGLTGWAFSLAAAETRVSISWKYSGGTYYPSTGTGTIPSDMTHVMLTYDGTTVTRYINGSSYGTPGVYGHLPNSTLGRLGNFTGPGGGAQTAFSTIRIYNRGLSAAEALQNANAGPAWAASDNWSGVTVYRG